MTRASDPVKVGVVGCGNISGIYLKNARRLAEFDIVAVADRDGDRARTRAAEFDIPRACSAEELLADADIELVLNLTPPDAHAPIALAALDAGKSVYNEKPLAVEVADGRRIVGLAKQKGLRVGCAPDTFLGGAWQTARKLLDDGAIGQPVAAVAFMPSHGPESWHPDPAFFYQPGAGPLFDMGPYYLTALIHLLGPVRRVTGSARISFPRRTITSEPRRGETIDVHTPTHVVGLLEFSNGLIATLLTSFDIWHANLPFIEVYGAAGSMHLPDPNGFGGMVRLRGAGESAWRDVAPQFPGTGNERGLGPADLARGLRTGQPHRASGELALHVLDVMHAILRAAATGRHVTLATTCVRPAPCPPAESP